MHAPEKSQERRRPGREREYEHWGAAGSWRLLHTPMYLVYITACCAFGLISRRFGYYPLAGLPRLPETPECFPSSHLLPRKKGSPRAWPRCCFASSAREYSDHTSAPSTWRIRPLSPTRSCGRGLPFRIAGNDICRASTLLSPGSSVLFEIDEAGIPGVIGDRDVDHTRLGPPTLVLERVSPSVEGQDPCSWAPVRVPPLPSFSSGGRPWWLVRWMYVRRCTLVSGGAAEELNWRLRYPFHADVMDVHFVRSMYMK